MKNRNFLAVSLVLLVPKMSFADASIIFQDRTDGQVQHLEFENYQISGGGPIHTPVPAGWTLKGVGDLDRDGTDDFVWQHKNGQVAWWTINNGAFKSAGTIGGLIPAIWEIVGVGDMNGDGYEDIVWRRDQKELWYWPIGTANPTTGVKIETAHEVDAEWTVYGIGDLDGNKQFDIIWQNREGQVAYWTIAQSKLIANGPMRAPVPPEWTIKGIADFNGDGKDDILWQNRTGEVYTWPGGTNDAVKIMDIGPGEIVGAGRLNF